MPFTRRELQSDDSPKDRAPRPSAPPQVAQILALQRSAGNAAVSALLSRAPTQKEVRVVTAIPTLKDPNVEYVLDPDIAALDEKRYDIDFTLYNQPQHYGGLSPAQVVQKLQMLWGTLNNDLNNARGEHLKLYEWRKEHSTAGFWSEALGGVEMPDPDMWNDIGRGPLSALRAVIDSTEDELKKDWEAGEAVIDRGLSPGLDTNPLMQAARAFDATQERIKKAVRLLDQAGSDFRECERRLDEYREGMGAGAGRAITGIKVSIVVVSATAGGAGASFAGEGAGLASQAAWGAATTGALGAAEEVFTQVGEMRIGEREEFDFAKIAKRGAKDVVTGFVGGVVGGKFSKVVKDRVGGWVGGLSDEMLATYGIAREELLLNGERLFIEWAMGNVAASPLTTTAGVLMDRALEGKWKVGTFGDFAGLVFDDMVRGAALGGFLTFAGHATGSPAPASAGRTGPGRAKAGSGGVSVSDGVPQPIHDEPSTVPHADPDAPLIEESPPGGFPEPPGHEPAPENPGPEPPQEHIDPDTGLVIPDPVPEHIHAEHPPAEQRVYEDELGLHAERKFPFSEAELRKNAAEQLQEAYRKMLDPDGKRIVPPEVDALIAEARTKDPAFADQIQQYYDSIADPKFLEEQMVYLWDQARQNGRTVAQELEFQLGEGVNEFWNTPGLKAEDAIREFQAVLRDPRALVDLSFARDTHGSHTHAFHQFLGDRLWGKGTGLEFRRKLAGFDGTGVTIHPGQKDEFLKPYWSRIWDHLFDGDATKHGLHSSEVLGKILQQVADFPRWIASRR
jgi:hypothetical protein